MSHLIEKEGFDFAFDPTACGRCEGNCCRGESGYVWLDRESIEQIADFLQMPAKEFLENYCKKVGYRYTLRELKIAGEHVCIFFDKGCTIYPVRPKQCRSYPFWDRYKDKKNLSEVCAECIGIVFKSS